MNHPATKLAFLPVALLFLAAPLLAQTDQGASLTIRLPDTPSRFHVGEVIRVEISFAASQPAKFDINLRNYDRSGRLDMEQFQVTPEGRDPLVRYYSMGGFMGGGIGASAELTSDSQILHADLNEWVALDTPGHYSLYVTSGRVSRGGETPSEPVDLRSNTVEFEVVAADPAWQHRTLTSAVATLNMESSTAEEKHAALRVLRFLDSRDSVVQLVCLLGTLQDAAGWDSIAGLAGARDQAFVVAQLEEHMSDPDIALTSGYLYILAKLKVQLHSDPLPPYPQHDPAQQATWNSRRETQDKEHAAIEDALYERAAALVLGKQEPARAETVKTLLERPSRGLEDVKPLGGPVAQEVARTFLALSPQDQWHLLLSFWPRLRVSEMLVPLKKLAQQPYIAHPMLRNQVLKRLYDLNPSEATPLFLEEIAHPHIDDQWSTVQAATLGLLPEKTLPQFEELLAGRLAQEQSRTLDLDAQLVSRFSTAGIVSKVKAAYQVSPDGWSCVAHDGFVSYFLRVEPDFGVSEVARSPSSCLTKSMAAVVSRKRWNEVEPRVIAWLNGPDFSRRRSAVESLAFYGSRQGEKALWDRLRRIRAQVVVQGLTLAYRPGMSIEDNEALQFYFGMIDALGKAQSWLLSDAEVSELEAMSANPQLESVKRWHWTSPVRVDISWFGEYFTAGVNQYSPRDPDALQAKLAQYPSGTPFEVSIANQDPRIRSLVEAIDKIAAIHGFQVEYQ